MDTKDNNRVGQHISRIYLAKHVNINFRRIFLVYCLFIGKIYTNWVCYFMKSIFQTNVFFSYSTKRDEIWDRIRLHQFTRRKKYMFVVLLILPLQLVSCNFWSLKYTLSPFWYILGIAYDLGTLGIFWIFFMNLMVCNQPLCITPCMEGETLSDCNRI